MAVISVFRRKSSAETLAESPNKVRVQFLRLICRNSQTIEKREEELVSVGEKGGAMSFSGLLCSGSNNHKTPALLARSLITGNPKVKPSEVAFSKMGPVLSGAGYIT